MWHFFHSVIYKNGVTHLFYIRLQNSLFLSYDFEKWSILAQWFELHAWLANAILPFIFFKYVKVWLIVVAYGKSKFSDRQMNSNLHSISSRTIRSTGGASFVFDAWHLSVLLYASLVKCGISRRFTMTCRPIATPPAVWIASVPLNQDTVGSGRPTK